MDGLGTILDVALLASMVRLVSPILLAALGGLLTERAGIFNVALEGLMLTGAFAAVVATSRTGDPSMGVLAAVAGGGGGGARVRRSWSSTCGATPSWRASPSTCSRSARRRS